MAKAKGGALISDNRKAHHYYELSEFTEAGIVLTGPEVKSLRAGKISFLDSYVDFKNGEAWLIGMNIAPYGNAGYVPQVPDRPRKLLLHRQELSALAAKVEQKGLTVVPVKLYFHNGRVKLEIALGRGRKLHDQRDELKRRAEARDTAREMAERQR
ncbi:MAG: SsrA-binding protein SmpB [Desulfovibrionaceae bacterium]|nr:SsrA-binding protein SmpB [Desulfovibrionaceae bacterium]